MSNFLSSLVGKKQIVNLPKYICNFSTCFTVVVSTVVNFFFNNIYNSTDFFDNRLVSLKSKGKPKQIQI